MNTFCYVFSDCIWLPLLQLFIFFVFLRSLIYDRLVKMRKGGFSAEIKRGKESWQILLSFWALSVIIIEIIVSSDLISNYRIIIGLINLGMLVYLNLFSVYFQNKIIGFSTKLQNREQKIV